MNDVKGTMERIGQRFDPPPDGLAELSRRRHRVDVRRRIAAGMLALVVSVGGTAIAAHAFFGPSATRRPNVVKVVTFPAASVVSPTPATTIGVKCPTPTGDSLPAVVLGSTSGTAGSSVQVSGSFQTGELWFQLWWNADDQSGGHVAPPPWPATGPDLQRELDPAAPGLMTELTSVAGPSSTAECSFRTAFTVPDVAPGRYQLLWVFGGLASPQGNGGFVLFLSPVTFEVTA